MLEKSKADDEEWMLTILAFFSRLNDMLKSMLEIDRDDDEELLPAAR